MKDGTWRSNGNSNIVRSLGFFGSIVGGVISSFTPLGAPLVLAGSAVNAGDSFFTTLDTVHMRRSVRLLTETEELTKCRNLLDSFSMLAENCELDRNEAASLLAKSMALPSGEIAIAGLDFARHYTNIMARVGTFGCCLRCLPLLNAGVLIRDACHSYRTWNVEPNVEDIDKTIVDVQKSIREISNFIYELSESFRNGVLYKQTRTFPLPCSPYVYVLLFFCLACLAYLVVGFR